MDSNQKYELITRNLQEIIGSEDLLKILNNRDLKIYWGTATTGKPHIAYFLPILKIRDFLLANCHVKILLADIHAFLDNLKAPFEQIESRTIYYEKVIKAMLKSLGIKLDDLENDNDQDINGNNTKNIKSEIIENKNDKNDKNENIDIITNLGENIEAVNTIQNIETIENENNKSNKRENNNVENIKVKHLNSCFTEFNIKSSNAIKGKLVFVKGSNFQTSTKYTMDLYKISTLTSERDAKKAGSQVVKQVDNPLLSSMIYPSMQALDEEYLGVDAQFGGVDQRKIFTYAMKYLPLLNYKKRIHLMNPMIPGLNSDKMSSSDQFSKIDLCDSKKEILKKIRKCFCEEGNKETGLLPLLKYIIFPIYNIKNLEINIIRKDLPNSIYKCYSDLENDFILKNIHPADLKNNVAEMVEEIIKPVREEMQKHIDITNKAYSTTKKKK